MEKLNFASDYMEGAHPLILLKLMETNLTKSVIEIGRASCRERV